MDKAKDPKEFQALTSSMASPIPSLSENDDTENERYHVETRASVNRDDVQPKETFRGEQQRKWRGTSMLQPQSDPRLKAWCSKKIKALKACRTAPQREKKTLDLAKIPVTIPGKVMDRATWCHCTPQNHGGNLQSQSRRKLKTPTWLMQRAQTQLWLADLSGFPINTAPCSSSTWSKTLFNTQRSATSTFCSVKSENLLGQLASSAAAPESGDFGLKTLEFAQNLIETQQEIAAAVRKDSEPRRTLLHRVTIAAQLQLEDSIALRQQADTLLGQRNIASNDERMG